MNPDSNRIYLGDCLDLMRSWPDTFVQTCVTSPPYWGLRDYKTKGQMGIETSPIKYVEKIVAVFREVRRILRDDGTLWLNLGDSYCTNPGNGRAERLVESNPHRSGMDKSRCGLKPKDLVGIPWRVAFALQDDGWYLRSDIIWAKPNPMPESVMDRPTKSHEYLFLLAKSEHYFYDTNAIKEAASYGVPNSPESIKSPHGQGYTRRAQKVPAGWDQGHGSHDKLVGRYKTDKQRGHGRRHDGFNARWDAMEKIDQCTGMRNRRSVWTVATAPFSEAHFATFPPELIKPCILAGSKGKRYCA